MVVPPLPYPPADTGRDNVIISLKKKRHRNAVFLRNDGATITLCAHWVCLSADQLPVAPVTKYTNQ